MVKGHVYLLLMSNTEPVGDFGLMQVPDQILDQQSKVERVNSLSHAHISAAATENPLSESPCGSLHHSSHELQLLSS